jgi:acetyl esterase/lipase
MSFKDVDSLDISSSRSGLDLFAGMVPKATAVGVEVANYAGLKVNWLRPAGARQNKLLLYLHGGAYIMGSCRSHRPFVSHIAKAAGIDALLPEYKLAPECPFPAALNDVVHVYRALLNDGYNARDIVVAGDSAGGGLALAMLLSLRNAGEPMPAAVALMSPWLDLTGGGESMQTRAARDPWFRPDDLPKIIKLYCQDEQRTDPLASPVFGDLRNLPPMLIQVGNDEILLSDSERASEKIRQSGGQVELEVWAGMWHVWQMFIGLVPESRAAVDRIGRFVSDKL